MTQRSDQRGAERTRGGMSVWPVRAASGLLALAGLLGSSGEASAVPTYTLEWQAPETCPGAGEVQKEIERSLSRVRGGAAVRVAGDVTHQNDTGKFTLHVRVEHDGEISERVLTVAECGEVARAAALFVVLAIEIRSTNPPEPEPPPPPSPKPAPSRWSLSFGPQVALGLAPNASVGLGGSLAYRTSPFRLVGRGSAFLPTYEPLTARLGGNFYLLGAAAFACGGGEAEPLGVWACLGGRVYQLRAQGEGTTADTSQTTVIGAPMLALEFDWLLAPSFSLLTGLEGGYALGTSRFVIENAGLVHETGRWLGEARIELGARF